MVKQVLDHPNPKAKSAGKGEQKACINNKKNLSIL